MEWLLSDEFVAFSQRIAEIHAEKKNVKQQLKDIYERSQARIKELDAQAQALSEEFERWKSSASEPQKPSKKQTP